MKILLRAIIIAFAFINPSRGEIILSEVLSNEPENRVLLEWIEVYNNGNFTIDLGNYIFIESGDTLDITQGMMVPADSYVVLCRRLEPDQGGDCFEYFWGDSSGVWGDNPTENYIVYEVNMTLANTEGSIYIYRYDGSGTDHFIWTAASSDGRSVERDDVNNPFSRWHECYDLAGSTPGRQNSARPADDERYFIQVEPQVVSLSGNERTVTISYGTPSGTAVSIHIFDDSALRRNVLLEDSAEPVGLLVWNLKDRDNKLLEPGLYFMSFRTSGEISVHKTIPIVIAP